MNWLEVSQTINNIITPIFTLVVVMISAIAAYQSRKSVLATKINTEASLFLQLLNEYNSEKMFNALNNLRIWKEVYGEKFIEEFEKQYYIKEADVQSERFKEVNIARREVKNYFKTILKLYRSGFLERNSMKELLSLGGIGTFFEIVEPLNNVRYLNSQTTPNRKHEFDEIYTITKELELDINRSCNNN